MVDANYSYNRFVVSEFLTFQNTISLWNHLIFPLLNKLKYETKNLVTDKMTRHSPQRCCTLGASSYSVVMVFGSRSLGFDSLGYKSYTLLIIRTNQGNLRGNQSYFRPYSTKSEINRILLSETSPTDLSSRCQYIVCYPCYWLRLKGRGKCVSDLQQNMQIVTYDGLG